MLGSAKNVDNDGSDSEHTKRARRERRNAKARDKREKHNLKKSRPKMPREVVVIKNVEKDVGNWMETYAKPKNRNIGCLPHPFRLCALGGVGRGKTNTLKNLFLIHQASSRPFKELYIVTCDVSSREFLDLEPTGIMDNMPDLDMFNPKLKTCILIDDFEFERISSSDKRKLSTLFRFVSSHRNVSIMCGYQSFFDTPSICRKCSNVFLIYKPNSSQELTCIANRVGLNGDELHNIFETVCNGVYDSLMVDLIPGTPARLRKNIYQVIDTSVCESD